LENIKEPSERANHRAAYAFKLHRNYDMSPQPPAAAADNGHESSESEEVEINPQDANNQGGQQQQQPDAEFPISAIEKIIKQRFPGNEYSRQLRLMLKDLLTAFINKATIEANEILEKSGRKMLTNFDFAEALKLMELDEHKPSEDQLEIRQKKDDAKSFNNRIKDPIQAEKMREEQQKFFDDYRKKFEIQQNLNLNEIEAVVQAEQSKEIASQNNHQKNSADNEKKSNESSDEIDFDEKPSENNQNLNNQQVNTNAIENEKYMSNNTNNDNSEFSLPKAPKLAN